MTALVAMSAFEAVQCGIHSIGARAAFRRLPAHRPPAHENHRDRHRLRRPGDRRLPGRARQQRLLPRRRPCQDRFAQRRQDPDLRARPRRVRRAQPRRRAPHVLDRRRRERRPRRGPVHRRRHAAGRGRRRRSAPRAGGRVGHRPPHERLQGRGRQVDRPGGHRRPASAPRSRRRCAIAASGSATRATLRSRWSRIPNS